MGTPKTRLKQVGQMTSVRWTSVEGREESEGSSLDMGSRGVGRGREYRRQGGRGRWEG